MRQAEGVSERPARSESARRPQRSLRSALCHQCDRPQGAYRDHFGEIGLPAAPPDRFGNLIYGADELCRRPGAGLRIEIRPARKTRLDLGDALDGDVQARSPLGLELDFVQHESVPQSGGQ